MRKITISAVVLAMAFLASCSSDNDGDNGDAGNSSSSHLSLSSSSSFGPPPSSSSVASSSSINNIIYGEDLIDNRDPQNPQTYKTVVIGEQTWMAENLNYDVPGSVCYENNPIFCEYYGRLYDWVTAMNLSKLCNNHSCSEDYSLPRQGICPNGWHLPSRAEWSVRIDKDNDSDILLGGQYTLNFFWLIGNTGFWWTSTEDLNNQAYPVVTYNSEYYALTSTGIEKSDLNSIRCVKNDAIPPSDEIIYGEDLIDDRDPQNPQTYKTVVIGKQTWMAENLNYSGLADNSDGIGMCYDNDSNNCNIYGRLYDWATAMNIEANFNDSKWDGSDVKHQGICPSGWHIPNKEEWMELIDYAGGYLRAGIKFKATTGWNNDYMGNSGNGTDIYGFSALPGGYFGSNGSSGLNRLGNWWGATEEDNIYDSAKQAFAIELSSHNEYALSAPYKRTYSFSIRCVKD